MSATSHGSSAWRRAGVAASAVLAAAAVHAAAVVEVKFVAPERFSDAGGFGFERDANLQRLEAHLQQLGQRRLADGQTLRIEVLDVDLAGRVPPGNARGDFRVLEGGADWPRISLRYTLESPGGAVQRGEDQLADLDYLGARRTLHRDEPLPYEKAMLDAWFKRRFTTIAPN